MIYVYQEVANISNNEFATIPNVRLKDPTQTCRLATFKIKLKDILVYSFCWNRWNLTFGEQICAVVYLVLKSHLHKSSFLFEVVERVASPSKLDNRIITWLKIFHKPSTYVFVIIKLKR